MKKFRAIGLMSGTSLDGIDAAMIETDGKNHIVPIDFLTLAYDDTLRRRLRRLCGSRPEEAGDDAAAIAHDMTHAHAHSVLELCRKARHRKDTIDIIGFHGHTVTHHPREGWSWQLGDGQLLADLCQCPVINDFRRQDMAHGGQGAPLAPLFHDALFQNLALHALPGGKQPGAALLGAKQPGAIFPGAVLPGAVLPGAVLNIGGVANLTLLRQDNPPIAFDTGPGNALLDDWIHAHTGQDYDEDGKISLQGKVADDLLQRFLTHPWFSRTPPKSLDRMDFDADIITGLSVHDGAATLCACTAAAVRKAIELLPEKPRIVYVCGGGRHNQAMMAALRHHLTPIPVQPIESIGAQSDAIEAQAFAWLAVRATQGLPLSLPSTTGVSQNLSAQNLSAQNLSAQNLSAQNLSGGNHYIPRPEITDPEITDPEIIKTSKKPTR